jgi:ATP-dependent helicase/nuclease subunit A
VIEHPHELFLASAGTGKTFQLTNHFLRLLFDGVPPERILATTFTRKAAGEILDRVLERLVAGARGGKALAELAHFTEREGLTEQHCISLLGGLTRAIDRFQVRTIDAFFVQLANLFALDLELPPDWSIVDEREDADLREEAVQSVLGDGNKAERLELLRGLKAGAAPSRVHDEVLSQLNDGRDLFLESDEAAWSRVQPQGMLDAQALSVCLDNLRAAKLPQTKTGKPNGHYAKALNSVVQAAEDEVWTALVEKGLGRGLLDCTCVYYKIPYTDDLIDALTPVITHAVACLVNDIAQRNQALHELLRRFEERYQDLKRSRGAYRFDDLPLALAGNSHTSRPIDDRELDLWFRLDGRLDHLLLDEFQDTAPLQWRILAPLAEEVLADGTGERSFFCVGDTKQSIYGWRKAEPRLLAGLKQKFPVLRATQMSESYRSSRVVLDTVNRVFSRAGDNAAFASEQREVEREAALAWQASYPEHVAAKELPGAAHVVMADEPDEERGERDVDCVVRRCVERVSRMREEAPGATVGILMRRKAWIPRLIHALRENGVPASGEGGNPLTDAESVLAFLSLLHLADYPEDSAAAFHLASTPLGARLQLELDADETQRRAWSREMRARLIAEGLGSVAEALAAHVATDDGWTAWDRQRFAQLVDLAYAFEDRAGLRPSAFAEHVRQERVEAGVGAPVRVMTIHASKGLEFDAVVLPELHASLTGQRDGLLSLRSDPYESIDAVSVAPTKALSLGSAELRELYDSATASSITEALCVIYVALTRAARRLEIVLPFVDREREAEKDRKGELSLNGSVLLRYALVDDLDAEVGEDGVLWSHPESDSDWARDCEAEATVDATEDAKPSFRLAPSRGPRSAPTRSPSATEGGGSRRAGSLLQSPAGATVGTIVHRWFEECEWVEDFALDEADLHALASDATGDEALIASASNILRDSLANQALRAALSRDAYALSDGRSAEVRNEHGFSVLLGGEAGHEELWNGFIDRLVLVSDGDRVVSADVIDYKTDVAPDEATLRARTDHYRPQLENYRRIVCAQFGLEPQVVRCRLLFLTAGTVIDV